MGALSEREIFDCIAENCRLAAENCDKLAARPISGPAYLELRDQLALIEGACRQAAAWRGQDKWLDVAQYFPIAHKMAGEWLRGIEVDRGDGVYARVPLSPGQLHPAFQKLAEYLRWAANQAEICKNAKIGAQRTLGDQLYQPPKGDRTQGHMGWRPTNSGLLVPGAA